MAHIIVELPAGAWCVHDDFNLSLCKFARYSKKKQTTCCVAFNKLLDGGKFPMKCNECIKHCADQESEKGRTNHEDRSCNRT